QLRVECFATLVGFQLRSPIIALTDSSQLGEGLPGLGLARDQVAECGFGVPGIVVYLDLLQVAQPTTQLLHDDPEGVVDVDQPTHVGQDLDEPPEVPLGCWGIDFKMRSQELSNVGRAQAAGYQLK